MKTNVENVFESATTPVESRGGETPTATPENTPRGIRKLLRRKHTSSAGGRTPRGVSQAASASDLDDHMYGSAFAADDVCQDCGSARGLSVLCPATGRHHGTDELPGKQGTAHGRTASGRLGKLAAHHKRHKSRESEGLGRPPLTPSRTPCTAREPDDESDNDDNNDDDGERERQRAAMAREEEERGTLAQRQGTTTTEQYHEDPQVGLSASAAAPAAAEEEEEVQYYCYTDENGETYYYAVKASEAQQQQQQQQEAAAAQGTKQTYIYECPDENGNIVQYMVEQTPEEAAATAAAAGAADPHSSRVPAEGAVEARGSAAASETSSQAAASAAGQEKKKGAAAFFSSLTSAFKKKDKDKDKKKEKERARRRSSEDEGTGTAAGASPHSAHNRSDVSSAVEAEAEAEPPAGIVHIASNPYDAAVEEFVASLDPTEAKRFEKERRKMTREVAEEEKKARERLAKYRREFMEDRGRELRAGLFQLQRDEAKVAKGSRKGEPL